MEDGCFNPSHVDEFDTHFFNAAVIVWRLQGKPSAKAAVHPMKPDPALWPPADFDADGFRPLCAWYLNDAANIAYARRAPNGGQILKPVMLLNGEYDQINTINGNRYGDPMCAAYTDLTIVNLLGAHWLPLERKRELVQAMRTWPQDKNLSATRP